MLQMFVAKCDRCDFVILFNEKNNETVCPKLVIMRFKIDEEFCDRLVKALHHAYFEVTPRILQSRHETLQAEVTFGTMIALSITTVTN